MTLEQIFATSPTARALMLANAYRAGFPLPDPVHDALRNAMTAEARVTPHMRPATRPPAARPADETRADRVTQALELHRAGRSYNEIAEIMDVSSITAGKYVQDGLRMERIARLS